MNGFRYRIAAGLKMPPGGIVVRWGEKEVVGAQVARRRRRQTAFLIWTDGGQVESDWTCPVLVDGLRLGFSALS